jgi:hypothetical protein
LSSSSGAATRRWGFEARRRHQHEGRSGGHSGDRWLRHHLKDACFEQTIPRAAALQTAAYFSVRRRSFWAKYPGQTGRVLRQLATELLSRLAAAQARPAAVADVQGATPEARADEAGNG